jgi:hypothetical protein
MYELGPYPGESYDDSMAGKADPIPVKLIMTKINARVSEQSEIEPEDPNSQMSLTFTSPRGGGCYAP